MAVLSPNPRDGNVTDGERITTGSVATLVAQDFVCRHCRVLGTEPSGGK